MAQHRFPDRSLSPHSSGENKSSPPATPVVGNLAVQASLMEIFDEFTEVISGELKTIGQPESPESKD